MLPRFVAVSQRFIDLLNLPAGQLELLAGKAGVEIPAGTKKWDAARQLEHLTRGDLEEYGGGYLYAGSTSISFVRLIPGAEAGDDSRSGTERVGIGPLRAPGITAADVTRVLRELSETDPFDENAHPVVSDRPALVVARERDDGSFLLTFVVQRQVANVIHDFESTPVFADEFFNAIIIPSEGLVELRTSARRVATMERTWLTDFADGLGREGVRVGITPHDFDALKQGLEAKLATFRGKPPAGGSMDTIEITKRPDWEDLEGAEDFEAVRGGHEQMYGELLFDHEERREVRIRVSVLQGSIFFRTPVPEGTLNYVREALREAKGRHA